MAPPLTLGRRQFGALSVILCLSVFMWADVLWSEQTTVAKASTATILQKNATLAVVNENSTVRSEEERGGPPVSDPPDCRSNASNRTDSSARFDNSQSTDATETPTEGFCSKFAPRGRTASSLWQEHLPQIINATLDPNDVNQTHYAWIERLSRLLTPNLLQNGLRSSPSTAALKRILEDLIYKRLVDPSQHRPIEIAVFGGSVTFGRGCGALHFDADYDTTTAKSVVPRPLCTWPARLQSLLQEFCPNLVKVYNLAVSGTGTTLILPLIRYKLYPPKFKTLRSVGPDVLVNSYSTNDSFQPAKNERRVYQNLNDLHRDFVETAQFSRASCHTRQEEPLTVYVYDFLGNIENAVLREYRLHELLQVLSDESGSIGMVSSVDVVRNLAFANSSELLFSGGHFSMAGHVAISWIVAYAILQVLVDYCQDVRLNTKVASKLMDSETLTVAQSDMLPFVKNSRLATVSSVLKTNLQQHQDKTREYCMLNATQEGNLCAMAFVAAQGGTVKSGAYLKKYIAPFIVDDNGGWVAKDDMQSGWTNKLGILATTPNASMTFQIGRPLATSAQVLTLYSLKSYGDAWMDSLAQFTIRIEDYSNHTVRYETSFNVSGYHEEHTSTSYPYVLDLGENRAMVGDTVFLKMEMVGGTNFKIMAIMVCSR